MCNHPASARGQNEVKLGLYIECWSLEFYANCFSYFQSADGGFSMYDCGILEEFDNLRLAVMDIGKMFVNCAAIAVALHAALQGGSC